MNIRSKYSEYRKHAKDGDIILWRGNSITSRLIRYFDDFYINDEGDKIKDPAYYTHSSIVYFGKFGRLKNTESWYNGITVVPASHRVEIYTDFCVLRPKNVSKVQIDHALRQALKKWDTNIPYDYFTLLRLAIIKKTGIDLTGLGKKAHYICSEFTQKYSLDLGIKDFYRRVLFTPQDHLRLNKDGFEVLFDDKLFK